MWLLHHAGLRWPQCVVLNEADLDFFLDFDVNPNVNLKCELCRGRISHSNGKRRLSKGVVLHVGCQFSSLELKGLKLENSWLHLPGIPELDSSNNV